MIEEKAGLRERKKLMVRDALIAAAERLVEARGYDNVTVAEIADAANVSVKTLFSYFRSKEDLIFTDDSLITLVLAALRTRGPGQSSARAIATALSSHMPDDDHIRTGLMTYQRAFGGSEPLNNRLLRLCADYELQIARQLSDEAGSADITPESRLRAAMLMAMIRSFTWPELTTRITAEGGNAAVIALAWLDHAIAVIDGPSTFNTDRKGDA